MQDKPILLVGRGASAYDFDWSSVNCPVMAVSSGIFAVPRNVHCDHFVTLDEPKNFMAQLMKHAPHAWEHDKACRYWPFWADASIVKHVHSQRLRTIVNRPLPMREIVVAINEWADGAKARGELKRNARREIIDAVYAELGDNLATFGLQPGWGDYQNMRGWKVTAKRHPKWTGDSSLAVLKTDAGGCLYNSLLMAVQVATRLEFKTLKFIGVDLVDEGYANTGLVVTMRAWHKHAVRHGFKWVNLSPISALCDFVPAPEPVAPQGIDIGDIARMRFGNRPTRIVPFFENGMMGIDIVPADEVAA